MHPHHDKQKEQERLEAERIAAEKARREKRRRLEAATRLQSYWRMHVKRSALRMMRKAIVKIQAVARGHLQRRVTAALRARRHAAAVKILIWYRVTKSNGALSRWQETARVTLAERERLQKFMDGLRAKARARLEDAMSEAEKKRELPRLKEEMRKTRQVHAGTDDNFVSMGLTRMATEQLRCLIPCHASTLSVYYSRI